jgi:hypothetical protein
MSSRRVINDSSDDDPIAAAKPSTKNARDMDDGESDDDIEVVEQVSSARPRRLTKLGGTGSGDPDAEVQGRRGAPRASATGDIFEQFRFTGATGRDRPPPNAGRSIAALLAAQPARKAPAPQPALPDFVSARKPQECGHFA